MTDRIIRKSNGQSAQSKYNLIVPKMFGNNKTTYISQKNYSNQNLPNNNKNITIIDQNQATENYSKNKNQEERNNYGTGSRQTEKIKNHYLNQAPSTIPQRTNNPKTKQSGIQQKSAKVKDLVDSHDLLKYFESGKIAQLSRALTNLKSDSNLYSRKLYSIQDWKTKQLEQNKALRRVNSDLQYLPVNVPPVVEKVPQNPLPPLPRTNIKSTVPKAINKSHTEIFCEQKLKKKDQLVEKLKVLKQNLCQTIQLLSSKEKGNDEISKVGKIGRIQTIVNSKLQVDVKELLKLARQMM